jgi:hypothetical protein
MPGGRFAPSGLVGQGSRSHQEVSHRSRSFTTRVLQTERGRFSVVRDRGGRDRRVGGVGQSNAGGCPTNHGEQAVRQVHGLLDRYRNLERLAADQPRRVGQPHGRDPGHVRARQQRIAPRTLRGGSECRPLDGLPDLTRATHGRASLSVQQEISSVGSDGGQDVEFGGPPGRPAGGQQAEYRRQNEEEDHARDRYHGVGDAL